MTGPITVFVPELPTETPPDGLRLAERSLPGLLRVALIDNSKPKATELLTMIASELSRRFQVDVVDVIRKRTASDIITDEQVAKVAASANAAICGLGDCGACSVCSLADALKLEAAGVPSTVVITDVFRTHVSSFATRQGMPGYHIAVVPHPVSSKSKRQLEMYAAGVSAQVAAHLTGSSGP